MLIQRTATTHLAGEDLVAVQGGYLTGRRRERVECHLATCVHCRQRLADYREVDRLVRRQPRLAVDPAKKAALFARLREESARPARPWFWRPFLGCAMAVLVLIAVTSWPGISEAGSLLGDFVRFGEIKVKERFEDPQPLAVPTASMTDSPIPDLRFDPFEPGDLPLGYALVAGESPKPDTLALYFENAVGDTFMLTQGPTKPGLIVVPPNAGDWATSIGGSPILVTSDPRPDVTGAVAWERHGIVFMLMTVDEPSGGLPVSNALAIVQAIITAHDEAVSKANQGAETP